MTGPVARARASLAAVEALDRLNATGSAPSPADLEELRGWAGWGPMAAAFAPNRSGTWLEIGERLEWLLPPDQLTEAQQATPTAFYTPPGLASACWQILTDLGFTSGKVLEPGCGAGAFIAAAPAEVRAAFTGIERDPVTAQIAGLLHPGARIVNERLQDAALAAHSMDAVIGNVPFSEAAVYDPTAPKAVTKNLHNYCIWRSVRTLRPGGIAVLITSRYTLDSREQAARLEIAAQADLLGAVRISGDALSSGGTEVVADILVLRRRETDLGEAGTEAARLTWIDSVPLAEAYPGQQWTYDDRVNKWYIDNPAMVLGQFEPDQAPRFGRTIRVTRPADAGAVDVAVAEAGRELAASAVASKLGWLPSAAPAPSAGDVGIPVRADGRKELSFHLIDSEVVQVAGGELVPPGRAGKELAELTSLVRLRDAAISLLDAEADHSLGEESLAPLRARLNAAYDQYAARYGALNRATITSGEPDPETGIATVRRRRPRMGGFRQDPDYVTVLALEDYDEETGQAVKAPIFTRRVNVPAVRPTHADTPAEAIRVCLDAHGRLDLPTIGRLLGMPVDQVSDQLAGQAYRDPADGRWVTAEEYLSGNVRDKLAAARAAGEGANVAALEGVQPTDLNPEQIRAKLGAPWIPPDDIRAFAAELLGYQPEISYLSVTSQWEIKIDRSLTDTASATDEWGTGRVDGYRLLELALNGRAPVIYDEVTRPDGGESRVRNQAETMLAEEKQRALGARFAEWAWEDPERGDRLCAEYNRRFNSVVLRRYDGSHLTFPGLTAGFSPYPHQLDMVHRIVSSASTLCPYPVGTGKTPIMFLAARKLKELGLAAKPLIVVPNHLLEQTAREGKRLFPAARILMAARDDLADAQARKLFAARCATGDWDAVVMTHSAFTAIPVHPSHQADHLTNLAATYRQALTAGPHGGSRTVKQLAKMIDAFETRAKTLLAHRTDDGVYWEHLGADLIQIDEAHYFKNLGVPVRTDGFSVAASKRASDLDMKLDLLRRAGGKVAALFTGTPVSNSLLEMYVLQHYLHPERLEEVGLGSADAWAANFVEFQTNVEVTPEGSGFRLKRRPVRFENVPELLTLFGEVTDLRPPDSFAIRKPAGQHHNVVISSSRELRDFVADLARRADSLHLVDAAEDNMLKICSDGRKAALDLGLVGIDTGRPGKVGAVVANIARIYHDTAGLALPGDDPARPGGGFQIVFCDLGTPNSESSQVYGQIRAGLAAAGVPAGRIRFIHHAATDSAKASLFSDCRAGKVAVLLGSTDKLGVGTNIQTRCVALHHVDAPWRPADVEQREGRALRPGNLNATVDLYRYVTEKSFDSFMWQALERKARFIGQVMSGQPAGRDVDDIGDATLSYAEVKALATGNPLLLELAEVNADVARLRQLATAHTRSTRRLRHSIAGWQEQITAKTRLAGDCDRISSTVAASTDPAWYTNVRQPIGDSDVAGHLARLVTETLVPGGGYPVAYWQGLRVTFTATKQWREMRPHATIWAGRASLDVGLNAAWISKGQHWRIEREITSAVTGAGPAAGKLRAEVTDLEQRIADATRRVGEPFQHSAELEAARTRRDAIESAIREAAEEPREADDDMAEDHDDDVYVIDPLDADGDREPITIRAIASPLPVAPDDDHAAGIDDRPAELTQTRLEAVTSGQAPRPPQSVPHPNALARLDGEPLSLFDLPAQASGDQAAAGVGGGPGVRAGRVRRAATDAAGQDALFELPSPATTADASRNRPRARRR